MILMKILCLTKVFSEKTENELICSSIPRTLFLVVLSSNVLFGIRLQPVIQKSKTTLYILKSASTLNRRGFFVLSPSLPPPYLCIKNKIMHPRIHLSKIWKIMEQTDSKGKALAFSFQYAKKNGELLIYKNATLSSIFSKGATVNILLEGENKPHTFRKIAFTRINDFKIYL
jgi:hypothetical protein